MKLRTPKLSTAIAWVFSLYVLTICLSSEVRSDSLLGFLFPAEVKLKLNLEKGFAYGVKRTEEVTVATLTGGAETKTTGKGVYYYSVECVDVNSNGDMLLTQALDRIILQADGPEGRFEYDSALSGGEVPSQFTRLATWLGKSVVKRVEAPGRVALFTAFASPIEMERHAVEGMLGFYSPSGTYSVHTSRHNNHYQREERGRLRRVRKGVAKIQTEFSGTGPWVGLPLVSMLPDKNHIRYSNFDGNAETKVDTSTGLIKSSKAVWEATGRLSLGNGFGVEAGTQVIVNGVTTLETTPKAGETATL